jgi:5-methylcytosine-specific restriction endonuclease McrA
MIPVTPAPEPGDFDDKVRQPGLSALAECVGKPPTITRPGPKRKQLVHKKKPVTRIEDIPPNKLPPKWRDALGDMLEAYDRVCAYACIYIDEVTGVGTIDHWIPKSKDRRQAYEWSNFRLACSMMNSRKGIHTNLADPFTIGPDWFEIDFISFDIVPGSKLAPALVTKVENTIEEFGLNEYECRTHRERHAEMYYKGEIEFSALKRFTPFLARELRRQDLLRPPSPSWL